MGRNDEFYGDAIHWRRGGRGISMNRIFLLFDLYISSGSPSKDSIRKYLLTLFRVLARSALSKPR